MQTFPRLREVGPVRNLKKAKLKREEWLKRKVRADQLLKKVFSRLLTERCEVQLVDIGFMYVVLCLLAFALYFIRLII